MESLLKNIVSAAGGGESFLPEYLVMTDCEMTGVREDRDHLLQAAFVKLKLEGSAYQEVGEPLVIYMPHAGQPENDFQKKYLTHIFKACNESTETPEGAKQKLHEWLGDLKGHVTPVGDCVPTDIAFLKAAGLIDRPDIGDDGPIPGTFHYEFFDLNSVKAFARHLRGEKFTISDLDEENIHDALVDCRNQTKELNAFIKVLVPDTEQAVKASGGIEWQEVLHAYQQIEEKNTPEFSDWDADDSAEFARNAEDFEKYEWERDGHFPLSNLKIRGRALSEPIWTEGYGEPRGDAAFNEDTMQALLAKPTKEWSKAEDAFYDKWSDEYHARRYAKMNSKAPAIFLVEQDGAYKIWNGRHRARAAWLRGERTIDAFVGSPSVVEASAEDPRFRWEKETSDNGFEINVYSLEDESKEPIANISVQQEFLEDDESPYFLTPYEDEPFHQDMAQHEYITDIRALSVNPKYQGQGVAKYIYNLALKEIKKRFPNDPVFINASPMGSARTGDGMELNDLIRFYQKAGFKVLKKFNEFGNATLWMDDPAKIRLVAVASVETESKIENTHPFLREAEKVFKSENFQQDYQDRMSDLLSDEFDEDVDSEKDFDLNKSKEDLEAIFKKVSRLWTKEIVAKGNSIVCYRKIGVEEDEIPVLLKKIKENSWYDKDDTPESLAQFDGLGIYWSWTKTGAEAYWGQGSVNVLIEAEIPLSSIDIEQTVLISLMGDGGGEREIRLLEDAKVNVTQVWSNGKSVLKGKHKTNASTEPLKGKSIQTVQSFDTPITLASFKSHQEMVDYLHQTSDKDLGWQRRTPRDSFKNSKKIETITSSVRVPRDSKNFSLAYERRSSCLQTSNSGKSTTLRSSKASSTFLPRKELSSIITTALSPILETFVVTDELPQMKAQIHRFFLENKLPETLKAELLAALERGSIKHLEPLESIPTKKGESGEILYSVRFKFQKGFSDQNIRLEFLATEYPEVSSTLVLKFVRIGFREGFYNKNPAKSSLQPLKVTTAGKFKELMIEEDANLAPVPVEQLPESVQPAVGNDGQISADKVQLINSKFRDKALRCDTFQDFQQLLNRLSLELELTEEYRESLAGVLNQIRLNEGYVAL